MTSSWRHCSSTVFMLRFKYMSQGLIQFQSWDILWPQIGGEEEENVKTKTKNVQKQEVFGWSPNTWLKRSQCRRVYRTDYKLHSLIGRLAFYPYDAATHEWVTFILHRVYTLNPERWIEIRQFYHNHKSRSGAACTPVPDPTLIPLLITAVTQKHKQKACHS